MIIYIAMVFLLIAIVNGFWLIYNLIFMLAGDRYLIGEIVKNTAIAVICLSIALICFGAYQDKYENTYSESAEASIISVEEKKSRFATVVNKVPVFYSRTKYEVRYTFVAADGVTYGGKDTVSSEPGDEVITIRYNPENPTENDIP